MISLKFVCFKETSEIIFNKVLGRVKNWSTFFIVFTNLCCFICRLDFFQNFSWIRWLIYVKISLSIDYHQYNPHITSRSDHYTEKKMKTAKYLSVIITKQLIFTYLSIPYLKKSYSASRYLLQLPKSIQIVVLRNIHHFFMYLLYMIFYMFNDKLSKALIDRNIVVLHGIAWRLGFTVFKSFLLFYLSMRLACLSYAIIGYHISGV